MRFAAATKHDSLFEGGEAGTSNKDSEASGEEQGESESQEEQGSVTESINNNATRGIGKTRDRRQKTIAQTEKI